MATAAQLGVGLLFLLILAIMQHYMETVSSANAMFVDDRHPAKTVIGKLPRCTPGCAGCLCHAFVYAPATAATKAIVDAMLADNVAAVGPNDYDHAAGAPFGVRAFANQSAVDDWLVGHPNATKAAVLFRRPARWAEEKKFAYDLQVNTTEDCATLRIMECVDPLARVRVPMQVALDQAFVRTHGGPGTASISITISNVPHPPVQHISAQNTAVMLLCL